MSDPLYARLKTIIVETLKLDDASPEDIRDDEPLFDSRRFALDSIDALELVVCLEREFGVKIGASTESRLALGNVTTLAAYIRSQRPGV